MNYHKSTLLTLFLLFVTIQFSNAQTAFKLFDTYIVTNDSLLLKGNYAQVTDNILLSENNPSIKDYKQELEVINTVFRVKSKKSLGKLFSEINEKLLKQSIDKALKLQSSSLEIWTRANLAFYYYEQAMYKDAVPTFLDVILKVKSETTVEVYNAPLVFKQIAYFLDFSKDYSESIYFFKKSLSLTKDNDSEKASILNSIANSYKDIGNYDQADYYNELALKYAQQNGFTIREAKIYGSQAQVFALRNQFEPAEKMFLKAIQLSVHAGKDENCRFEANKNTVYTLVQLGNLYLSNNKIDQLEKCIDQVKAYQQKDKSSYEWHELSFTELYQKYASKVKDDALDLLLRRRLDSLNVLEADFVGDKVVNSAFWRIQKTKFQLQKERAEVKVEKAQNKFVLLMITSVSLLLIIASFVLSFYQRKRKEKIRFQTLIKSLLTQNKNINLSRLELEKFANSKNDELSRMQEQYKAIEQEYIRYAQLIGSDNLNQLLKKNIATEERWEEFKRLFSAKYPEYFQYVQLNFPEITDVNLRIVLLLKLGFTQAKISECVGISQDSVKKAIQRLRKKVGERYEDLFEIKE